jgi:glycosyltransferase involved in cell wall biosynthesis
MNQDVEHQKSKKTVTWVTPDYFIDCDFNPAVFAGILQQVNIIWIVLLPSSKARFSEADFEVLKAMPGLEIKFIYWLHRARNPKMLLFYEQVYRLIKQSKPDLIYFNYVPTSPYVLPLYWRLKKNTTIVTAHDGNVKPSFDKPGLAKIVFKLAFGTVKHVNMFSKSEARLFNNNFPNAKVSVIPLGLKDFGAAVSSKKSSDIVFLFFGSIHSNKDVGLLINAACDLYESGVRGFKISIHGYCSEWNQYANQIRYPELFQCDIRLHTNSEIPELFAKSDYAIFPYKDVSQSGALKVAFNYNIPVITSNLSAFTDEVKFGVNGYTFEAGNLNDLKRVMSERLKNHKDEYPTLVNKLRLHNEENYAANILVDKYLDIFNDVLSKD